MQLTGCVYCGRIIASHTDEHGRVCAGGVVCGTCENPGIRVEHEVILEQDRCEPDYKPPIVCPKCGGTKLMEVGDDFQPCTECSW